MKKIRLAVAALLGLFAVVADAVHEVDLASDSAWRLSADGGVERAIVVPGGGWNSDLQKPHIPTMEGVKDYVVYRRRFKVPAVYSGQVVKIRFGAVNYGADVYVDGKLAGSHVGPAVPFAIDISAVAAPGVHELKVKAYHRRHYILANGKAASVPVAFDFPENSKEWCHWSGNSKYAYGITRSVKLLIYPAVYIDDIFVRPSVTDDTLSVRMRVKNTTGRAVRVDLNSVLSSWNGDKWKYPSVPKLSATVKPGASKALRIKLRWGLGRDSYWWPNIPFKEDYQAKLHFINITLSANGKQIERLRQRFGFVEWGEGDFYYTVNGVRVMQLSDSTCESQMSCYDSYGMSPAFQAPNPAKGQKGCAETWKRYMRIGFNINRLCGSPPTELMLNSADEVGFMLMPEAPIWGNHLHRYNPKVTPDCIRSLVRLCRNHPSVARYSLANEVRPHKLAESAWINLIAVANEEDGLRPLSYDLHRCGSGRVEDGHGGHAAIMEHYPQIEPTGGSFRACGESCWQTDGLLNWAYTVRKLRLYDWAYGSCWSWINYWPNFLEGMSHDRHAWKPQNAPDRTAGKNGTGSPIVKFVQKSMDPYLIIDRGIRKLHKQAKGRRDGDGSLKWPQATDCYRPGGEVRREIEIFNGGLSDGTFQLVWEARLGSPTGAVLASGKTPAVKIKAGFHQSRTIDFKLPVRMNRSARCFYLVMHSLKDGKPVFVEDQIFFNIVSKEKSGYSVKFVGIDTDTHGSFRSKYGRNGFIIAKDKNDNMPGFIKLKWITPPKMYVWNGNTDDVRALPVFSNENSVQDKRIAACWHDRKALDFTIDTGMKPQRVSLYFLNWDKKNSGITVRVTCGAASAVKSLPANYSDAYMSFNIRGNAHFTVTGVKKPILSAMFFDD